MFRPLLLKFLSSIALISLHYLHKYEIITLEKEEKEQKKKLNVNYIDRIFVRWDFSGQKQPKIQLSVLKRVLNNNKVLRRKHKIRNNPV